MKVLQSSLTIALAAIKCADAAAAVATLFDIDQASCGQYLQTPQGGGVSVLQQFVNEAAAMNGAALAMYQNAVSNNPNHVTLEYLAGLFGGLRPGDQELATMNSESSTTVHKKPD
jgi:hypothetical protein